jgi:hypothetical protein
VILACIIAFVFTLPIGIIRATTNQVIKSFWNIVFPPNPLVCLKKQYLYLKKILFMLGQCIFFSF